MKKFISFFLVFLLTMAIQTALGKEKEEPLPRYTIEGNGTGAQGTYLIKVTIVSKNKNTDESTLRKCAVHGVLFKGFTNNNRAQRPLAGSQLNESEHADFYKDFFSTNGPAENYASTVDGSISYVKSGKEYKVSAIVSVNKDQLRKDLQAQGIIKGLTNGF